MSGKLSDGYNIYNETIDPTSNTIYNILQDEKNRLSNKEAAINPLYQTRQRQKQQIQSEALRTKAYYKMLYVFFFMLILCVLLFIMKKNFPIFPDFVFDLLLIVVFGGGIIWLLILQVDISKRDKMDFQKIDFGLLLDPKTLDNGTSISDRPVNKEAAHCAGKDCCSTGQIFEDNQCKEPFVSGCMSTRNEKPYTPKPTFSQVA